jgi:hypothetical protein
MPKHLISLISLSIFLCTLVAAAADDKPKGGSLASGPIDAKGKWEKYKVGQPARWVVWHTNEGWRVATTTAGRKRTFRGLIKVEEGTFTSFRDYGNVDQKGKRPQDRGVVNRERNQLLFQFDTAGHEDAFLFTVSQGAKSIQFSLLIDGKEMPGQIYIGKEGKNPPSATFTLPAFP